MSPDKNRRETDRRRRRGWEICLLWVDRTDRLKLLDLKWDMAKDRVWLSVGQLLTTVRRGVFLFEWWLMGVGEKKRDSEQTEKKKLKIR